GQKAGGRNIKRFDMAGMVGMARNNDSERAKRRHSVYCLLPPASCLLLSAFCLLLTAFCHLLPASCLLPPAFAQDTPADNWSQFRGNHRLTGVSQSNVPRTLKLLWTYEAGNSIDSSAAIVGGTVFVGSQKGEL